MMYDDISEQQNKHPDAFFIALGDFNRANLKTVLPKFYQQIHFGTRGNNSLDKAYACIQRGIPICPTLAPQTTFHVIMLTPVYRPWVKLTKPAQKTIQGVA